MRIYLNPLTGRFNALDSFKGENFDPQSLHKYAYCGSDPENASDPSGLLFGDIISLLSAVSLEVQLQTWNAAVKIAPFAWAVAKIALITWLASTAYRSLASQGWLPESRFVDTLNELSGTAFFVAIYVASVAEQLQPPQGQTDYGKGPLSRAVQSERIRQNLTSGATVSIVASHKVA